MEDEAGRAVVLLGGPRDADVVAAAVGRVRVAQVLPRPRRRAGELERLHSAAARPVRSL